MKRIAKPNDYVFQASWEVCNKIGGIYTVLSTQAKALEGIYKDNIIYRRQRSTWAKKEFSQALCCMHLMSQKDTY